jgi:hypothetical protein
MNLSVSFEDEIKIYKRKRLLVVHKKVKQSHNTPMKEV